LRAGARVVVTSRFKAQAQADYAGEPDHQEFGDRLDFVELDFRDATAVEAFANGFLARFGPLDILVNNASRSVLRSWEAAGTSPPSGKAGEATADIFVDNRNTWTLPIEAMPVSEVVDALLVGAAAPFILTGRLKSAMTASSFPDRYVINVSGLDGRFNCPHKHALHGHINLSKAAINMLTRTAAAELADSGIYMNSVDVGWVSYEAGALAEQQAQARGQVPPLDPEDAAARILDPICPGHEGGPPFGQIFRNFRPSTW
jgi:NAD(P)-dependent dehydrogenase (short-subunit alcohol dehydrogenase family)